MSEETDIEKKKLIYAMAFPGFLLLILWLIKLSEVVMGVSFVKVGIYPREFSGLLGLITAPLIHGSFSHLINNSVSFLLLGTAVFYFYNVIAFRVTFLTWVIAGFWVWVAARPSYHIGASMLIYGYASFLFFSGVFRNDMRLLAISLLVTFLYGGMVWGILPIEDGISWEGHLAGGLVGLVLAYFYRKTGPKKYEPYWMKEEEEDDDEIFFFQNNTLDDEYLHKRIKYHNKEKDES